MITLKEAGTLKKIERLKQPALDIFTWGNPSRGDDAIGPLLHLYIEQLIAEFSLENIHLIEDFQLQPEHILDISGGACIVFIDASYQGDSAFQISSVNAAENIGYTSHALSPEALLTIYEKIQNRQAPPAFMLSVRGYSFALGAPLSKQAEKNINVVRQFLTKLLFCQEPLRLLEDAQMIYGDRPHA